jgi:putative oxidoreductase
MPFKNYINQAVLYLRIAIAVPYLWFVSDRLGFIGKPGKPHVSWGDWPHFVKATSQTISFLPSVTAPFFAVAATLAEGTFGLLLLIGLFTWYAAIGSGVLSLLFAVSMAISGGIESPLGYSVFTLSAASFLLSAMPEYKWSVDAFLLKTGSK